MDGGMGGDMDTGAGAGVDGGAGVSRGAGVDARVVREDSVVVAEFGALEDCGGRPVRFAVRRAAADGTWLVEIAPHVLGVARAEDLRHFAHGILDTLAAGAGESDFLDLYDDGRTEATAVVGFDENLPYVIVDAYTHVFGPARDRIDAPPSGEATHANPVATAHLEVVSASRADPRALESGARALLAALNG
ncbi:hypothetical protein OS965_01900 [Streptomyces sp. H27-G5]|uniref:hypothetical protein n=1 Tax=Streptomyces sp. H27-G5 TaxID=2996698 RepID=UPI00226F4F7B|nr:hypothetical protein [Streptomyces sp. H27-G5]MCY0916931.1 hypothetical protein [Streptomyces sp. H27-G5]